MLALLLARYRLRPAGTTRNAWLEDLARRKATYSGAWSAEKLGEGALPPPPWHWLRAGSVEWHLETAEKRCRQDGAFAERVATYGRLLRLLDEAPADES